MKIEKVMSADEKLVKAEKKEAQSLFGRDRNLIKPVVVSPLSSKPKVGTGWSIAEIQAADLTRKQMRKLHLRIDKFRRTTHEDNVNLLKKIKDLNSGS